MADCKICGETFYPAASELLMINSGELEEICLACAMAQADDASSASDGDWVPISPMKPREKVGDYSRLYRVEYMDKDGRTQRFIGTPPRPLVPTYPLLRRDKPYDLHVDVFGPKRGLSRREHEPEVKVHTNIDSFSRTGQNFWAKKVPSFICPLTGVDVISVDRKDILCVVNEAPGLRVVKLKDGRCVNLRYK